MSVTQVKFGKHRCDLPRSVNWQPGDIVRCDDCGRWWRNHQPGNPDYATWKRAWIRQWWKR